MSPTPENNLHDFSIAASHNDRQNVNQLIKNYIVTASNFWIRYSDSPRRSKTILVKEVLDFIFANGGRVRHANSIYDKEFLKAHPKTYSFVIDSLKDYISDQITKLKKKLKALPTNNKKRLPPLFSASR
jgi:hypothetical protein